MKTETKLIENLDPNLWRQFVGLAKIKDMKAGVLLNEVIAVFLEKQKVIDQDKKEVLKNDRRTNNTSRFK